MDQVYVGLDLGSSLFQQVVVNATGALTLNRSFSTSQANLRKAFADLKGEIHVHLEASELAPWAASVIRPAGHSRRLFASSRQRWITGRRSLPGDQVVSYYSRRGTNWRLSFQRLRSQSPSLQLET